MTEVLGTAFETRDVRDDFAPWSDILARTSSPVLRDDPDFETIPDWRGGLYAMLCGGVPAGSATSPAPLPRSGPR